VRQGDNVFGPMALCLWARSSRGQFPIDELVGCLGNFSGNNLGSMCVLMSEDTGISTMSVTNRQ